MELINYANQNTLPEQVSVNKKNIEILADKIDELGYTLRGEYDATASYAYNDVVFYNYCFYRVSDEEATAIVGVVPTNTTYWQQVTGSIRGQAGSQGNPGPAGQDGQNGQDGAPTLFSYNTPTANQLPAQGITIKYNTTTFNRTPVQNEEFLGTFMYNNELYMGMLIVVTVASPDTSCNLISYAKMTGPTGAAGQDGTNGKDALFYDKTIQPFTWSGDSTQLLTGLELRFSNFNRTPGLNEDFVGILYDSSTQKTYIAQCEVQAIGIGNYVSEVVASQIHQLSGPAGADGQDGEPGVTGLMLPIIVEVTSNPTSLTTIEINTGYFNRRPRSEGGEKITIFIRNTVNQQTFISDAITSNVTLATTTLTLTNPYAVPAFTAGNVDSGAATSGQVLTANGSGGASWETPAAALNNYSLELIGGNLTNATYIKRFAHIFENAKSIGKIVIKYQYNLSSYTRIGGINAYTYQQSGNEQGAIQFTDCYMNASGKMIALRWSVNSNTLSPIVEAYEYDFSTNIWTTATVSLTNISIYYLNDSEITA